MSNYEAVDSVSDKSLPTTNTQSTKTRLVAVVDDHVAEVRREVVGTLEKVERVDTLEVMHDT